MPGTIICVRFGESELAGLDELCRNLGGVTRSWAIRAAVARRLAESFTLFQVLDKEEPLRYDRDDLPEVPPNRSEPDVVTPPAAPGLPALEPLPPCLKCGRNDCPPGFHCSTQFVACTACDGRHAPEAECLVDGPTPSRSQQRRVAAQKGEPAPEFGSLDEGDSPLERQFPRPAPHSCGMRHPPEAVCYLPDGPPPIEPLRQVPEAPWHVTTETTPVDTESLTFTVSGPGTPSVLSPFATEPPKDTTDMTADELDEWMDKVMAGKE